MYVNVYKYPFPIPVLGVEQVPCQGPSKLKKQNIVDGVIDGVRCFL